MSVMDKWLVRRVVEWKEKSFLEKVFWIMVAVHVCAFVVGIGLMFSPEMREVGDFMIAGSIVLPIFGGLAFVLVAIGLSDI